MISLKFQHKPVMQAGEHLLIHDQESTGVLKLTNQLSLEF